MDKIKQRRLIYGKERERKERLTNKTLWDGESRDRNTVFLRHKPKHLNSQIIIPVCAAASILERIFCFTSCDFFFCCFPIYSEYGMTGYDIESMSAWATVHIYWLCVCVRVADLSMWPLRWLERGLGTQRGSSEWVFVSQVHCRKWKMKMKKKKSNVRSTCQRWLLPFLTRN